MTDKRNAETLEVFDHLEAVKRRFAEFRGRL